jgi:hypothetical protein
MSSVSLEGGIHCDQTSSATPNWHSSGGSVAVDGVGNAVVEKVSILFISFGRKVFGSFSNTM